MPRHIFRSVFAAAILLGGCIVLQAAPFQERGIQRAEIQRLDLVVPGREVIQLRVEMEQDSEVGRHRHPGDEIMYVLEGSVEFEVEGRPAITLSAGEGLSIPSGVFHTARNTGNTNAAVLATYIVEIGKPLVVVAE